jgi:simple sugar transport system substrate-binding protein
VYWEPLYIDIIEKVLDGTYTSDNLQDVDYFWLLEHGAVELGAEPGVPVAEPFVDDLRDVQIDHPEFGEIDAFELVMERNAQMERGREVFDPFEGPIRDRNGNLVYEEGHLPSIDELLGIEWAAENVVGPWDNEPQ